MLRRLRRAANGAGGGKMEFVIGLAIMAIIWVVVIYGSSYVNKNVQ